MTARAALVAPISEQQLFVKYQPHGKRMAMSALGSADCQPRMPAGSTCSAIRTILWIMLGRFRA
jgi:hypothetical protein